MRESYPLCIPGIALSNQIRISPVTLQDDLGMNPTLSTAQPERRERTLSAMHPRRSRTQRCTTSEHGLRDCHNDEWSMPSGAIRAEDPPVWE